MLTVVGAGISGIACAAAAVERGVPVRILDRGRAIGGRMASRTLRDTGTAYDGHIVDIGASYFTARHPDFVAAVDSLTQQGVVRPWTDAFHVAGPDGISGVRSGPMRYAAPGGLRSVVQSLGEAAGLTVASGVDVTSVTRDSGLLVDGEPADAVAVCMPSPQAQRICSWLPASPLLWEPVIAVTMVFDQRLWQEIDGVFVNDHPTITWIADDGARRGDFAPVLVSHMSPVASALHLDNPTQAIAPVVAATQRVLGIKDLPTFVDAHRWTYAKPAGALPEPYWLDESLPVGVAGDAWADGPRVETAWLSGSALGMALAARLGH
jgi:predicted NAD/FAD-dependent oxidoreductase